MSLTPDKIYGLLSDHFGNQDWWPVDKEYHKDNGSDSRFEIIVGAILTQNTAWGNVEKALVNLKTNNFLTVRKIEILASHVHENYGDDLGKFFNRDLQEVRRELLSLNGIGPETADSILLYAGNHPIFVVDAYTKRICKRVSVKIRGESYDRIQQYFEGELHKSFPGRDTAQIYKELHALIVELAKNYCKKKPECNKCPLKDHCEFNLIKSNSDSR